MKQLTTILMLALIGYNSIGFYFVFKIKKQKAELEFAEWISSGSYSNDDLTLFKVAVKEYSEGNFTDFHRVEGDFKQNGKFYEIVKETIQNDTVYVYCLNNQKEEQLYANLAEHINTHISESKSSDSNKTEKASRDLSREYVSREPIQVRFIPKCVSVIAFYSTAIAYLESMPLTIPTPPPQFA